MTIKERLSTFGSHIARILAYTLTAIAGVAISWFYVSEFDILSNWYSLPVMAIFTGLVTAFIPWIGKRFYPAYAVTSAGIAIFAILIATHYMANFFGFLSTFVIIAIIGVLSDLILSEDRLSLVDIALDCVFSFIAAIFIAYLPSIWTVAVITITYVLVLIIQVKPELFSKKKTSTK